MKLCPALGTVLLVMLTPVALAAQQPSWSAPTPDSGLLPYQGPAPALAAPCCDDASAGCRPWYAEIGVLLLQRETFGSGVPLVVDGGTGIAVLSSNDFQAGTEPGLRLMIGQRLGNGAGLEFLYFGLQEWNESAFRSGSLNVPIGSRLKLTAFDDVAQVRARYRSQLHNVELNVRNAITSHSALLGGVRYLNIHDNYSLLSIDDIGTPGNDGTLALRTDNNLVGLQIGGATSCPVGTRFGLGVHAKAGAFLNFLDADARLFDPQNAVDRIGGRAKADIAWLLEAGVMGRYRMTNNLYLLAGYEVLFLDGVGLAIEQGLNTAGAGSALYHGARAGVELLW